MNTEESTIQVNIQHDLRWKINYKNIKKRYKINEQKGFTRRYFYYSKYHNIFLKNLERIYLHKKKYFNL